MKITVFAAGSRGDIQPCVLLGKGLQQAGYQVCMAVPENFASFIQGQGLDFYPLRGDVQQLMASETGRNFMENGSRNPIKSIRAIRTMIHPYVMAMTEDAFAACENADGIICLGVFSAFGHAIAEALDVPIINIEPTPLLWSRAFPAPSWPIQKNLGGIHNSISGLLMLQVIWQWYRPFIHAFRKRLGLPSTSFFKFCDALRSTPMISAYSSSIIPQPPDWPENVHITGYFFPETDLDWQPSPELQSFLEAGDPPIYFGFGSMAGQESEQLSKLILDALKKCGQRGLLLTGWGGLKPGAVPDSVFVLDAAPHSWLFPRMAAVVHHGGAGTTAEGLRAGIPSVIVPFILDQPFWGARIKALGVGPAPIPHKHLTVDRLAKAIKITVSDLEIKQSAKSFGNIARAEDGVRNAVRAVQSYFGIPISSTLEK